MAEVARGFTFTAGRGVSLDETPVGEASTVDVEGLADYRPTRMPAPKPATASSAVKSRVMGFMSVSGFDGPQGQNSQSFSAFSRLFEGPQRFRALLEEPRQIGQYFEGGGTEVMFNALDVGALGIRIEAE